MMPTWFSREISLGNVIAMAVMLGTFYKFHIANVQRIAEIETKVNLMWSHLKRRLQINDEDE